MQVTSTAFTACVADRTRAGRCPGATNRATVAAVPKKVIRLDILQHHCYQAYVWHRTYASRNQRARELGTANAYNLVPSSYASLPKSVNGAALFAHSGCRSVEPHAP